jgi:lysozyme
LLHARFATLAKSRFAMPIVAVLMTVALLMIVGVALTVASFAAARGPGGAGDRDRIPAIAEIFGSGGVYPLAPAPVPVPVAGVAAHSHAPPPTAGRSASAWLHGVDVSKWNHVVRWRRVRAAGQTFAIMKATEGRDWVDPKYARNRRRALRAGLVVAAYHFARPDRHARDARIEADHFLRVARIRAGDIIPVLDLETSGDLTRRGLIHWTWAWLNEVRRRTGVRPMIYTGWSRWKTEMRNTQRFARAGYPLWLASWTRESPPVPAHNWGGHGWTFWQHGACGHVPGIRKCVDMDRFRGRDLGSVRIPTGLASTSGEGAGAFGRRPHHCGPGCLLRHLRRSGP